MRTRIEVEGGYLDYDTRTRIYHVYQVALERVSYMGCTPDKDEAIQMIKE